MKGTYNKISRFLIALQIFIWGNVSSLYGACDQWELPPSSILKKDIRQFDSGMCYAHRDSKAMEFFHKSINLKKIEPSVLELSTTFHRKLFFLKQIFSKYQNVNYKKGESILDWGFPCDGINYILENGMCDNSMYASSSFHYIYNIVRNLPGINLEICDNCEPGVLGLSNENKKLFSSTYISLAKKEIENDSSLTTEDKGELNKLVEKIFTNDKKINYHRLVKIFERKVKKHCQKRKLVQEYEGYICKSISTGTLGGDSITHNKLVNDLILKSLKNRDGQALMVGLCGDRLSSTRDLKELNGYDIVGYTENCRQPHAVLLVGAKSIGGRCEVLIEDNYPGVCDEKSMRWVTCEVNKKGEKTGRYWIETERLAPILTQIGKIEKEAK